MPKFVFISLSLLIPSDCHKHADMLQFSRKVSQPEEGKNHSSAKLAVILSDCTEIATGDAASLRYGI